MSLCRSRNTALVRISFNAILSRYPSKASSGRARWSSVSQQPGADQYATSLSRYLNALTVSSVHFPGAVNSKFTTKLSFERPSTHPAIPTYRVMDSDGIIVDEARAPVDVSDEEVLSWYRNMVTGACSYGRECGWRILRKEC